MGILAYTTITLWCALSWAIMKKVNLIHGKFNYFCIFSLFKMNVELLLHSNFFHIHSGHHWSVHMLFCTYLLSSYQINILIPIEKWWEMVFKKIQPIILQNQRSIQNHNHRLRSISSKTIYHLMSYVNMRCTIFILNKRYTMKFWL